MRVLISGACGRMGRAVASCAGKMGIEIACGVDPCEGKTDFPLYADFSAVTEDVDCIIEAVREVVAYLRGMSPVWRDLTEGKTKFVTE